MSSKQQLPTDDLIGTMSKEEISTLIDSLPTFNAEDFNPDLHEVELIEPQFSLQAAKKEELVEADRSVKPNLDEDFNLATANLRAIIQNSDTLFRDLVSVARTSESPRAYEVVTTMINTLVTANQELLNLHKKHLEIRQKELQAANAVNAVDNQPGGNNLLVCTPTDLLDFIKQANQAQEVQGEVINNDDQP